MLMVRINDGLEGSFVGLVVAFLATMMHCA